MNVAIIPARGGSKRLPRKNVLPFAGRPLIAWSILAAQNAKCIDKCVVSSDDQEILDVASRFGADLIERPAELARDGARMTDVLIHAVRFVEDHGRPPESIVLLQPTNPLRPVSLIEQAHARFKEGDWTSLVTVSERALKMGRVDGDRFLPGWLGEQATQQTAPTAFENGLLYIVAVETLLEDQSIYGPRICAHRTERPFDEVDIDDAMDLAIGECIAPLVADRLGY